ncbi:MAG: CTP synthase [Patescibacteria group bacterium]
MSPRFIFVSGGVISGLGKGITAASVGLLLKSQGVSVLPVKCDMYLNIDAGTMNPLEHGEIFVTDDGTESDQDLGHYERFLGITLSSRNYITAGQVYQTVLTKERALAYGGKCVEAYFSVPQEIMERLEKLGQKSEVVIIEFGGTVGEYQNILFFEAARRMKIKYKEAVLFIHVGYLPTPSFLGEMKTKPLQMSIQQLNGLGIQPDIIVCRSRKKIDQRRKEKISLAAALEPRDIFANPDLELTYKVPLVLEEQKLTKRILTKLGLKEKRKDLLSWRGLVKKIEKIQKKVKIGIVGKYYTSGGFTLKDSYVSVIEAVKHAAWANGVRPETVWFDSQKLEKEKNFQSLLAVDGIIIPQGWGSRGVEGKIKAVRLARENKIPYLGLCFGMQMAVIEFARNVLGLKGANSTEVDSQTPHPVIHIMSDQKKYLEKHQYGGTIRLGAWKCRVLARTKLSQAYGKAGIISERHRHRYEFNNHYREKFEKGGLKISGVSPDRKLVEAVEISDHPFFVGTQFHPEYKSRFLSPHRLFLAFIKATIHKKTR